MISAHSHFLHQHQHLTKYCSALLRHSLHMHPKRQFSSFTAFVHCLTTSPSLSRSHAFPFNPFTHRRPLCARNTRLVARMTSSAPPSTSISPTHENNEPQTACEHPANTSMFAPDVSFAQLGVSDDIVNSLAHRKILTPTRVQAALIPLLLQGLSMQASYAEQVKSAYELAALEQGEKSTASVELEEHQRPLPPSDDVNDVLMVGAETGSGKTLAYLLPYVQTLSMTSTDLKAIILVPSRELCWQTSNFLKSYFDESPPHLVLAGGAPPDVADIKAVKMIIATPSALLNYFRFSQKADLSDKIIVVDEADMLLSGGFVYDIERILDQPGMKPFATRRNNNIREINRNRLLFVGATYPHWTGEKVRSIVTWMRRRYPDIKAVQTQDIHKHSTRLNSRWAFEPNEQNRLQRLVDILRNEASSSDKVMVFASAADAVQRIAKSTEELYGKEDLDAKFGCALQLHKLVRSADRTANLDKFRKGEGRLLFCTDLGSRGLDLGDVTRVIEFEFASNVVAYLHRIGRTARAGAAGITDHFFDETSRPLAEAIKSRAEMDTTVVDGVFSRNRSFRRKLKKRLREQLRDTGKPDDQDDVAVSMAGVDIDEPDEEERQRFNG